MAHHRLEHLRRGDDRPPPPVGFADDLLLERGNGFGRELDSQVAPRHHHSVRDPENVDQVVDGLRPLDLRDDGGPPAVLLEKGAELADVFLLRTKDMAMKSTSSSRPRIASRLSFSVSAGAEILAPGS
jgi:hypothetical protein